MSRFGLVTAAGRHRRAVPTETARGTVGSDGLTDAERRRFLAEFRAGIGSKPADTADTRKHLDELTDKLSSTHPAR